MSRGLTYQAVQETESTAGRLMYAPGAISGLAKLPSKRAVLPRRSAEKLIFVPAAIILSVELVTTTILEFSSPHFR